MSMPTLVRKRPASSLSMDPTIEASLVWQARPPTTWTATLAFTDAHTSAQTRTQAPYTRTPTRLRTQNHTYARVCLGSHAHPPARPHLARTHAPIHTAQWCQSPQTSCRGNHEPSPCPQTSLTSTSTLSHAHLPAHNGRKEIYLSEKISCILKNL